MRAGGLIRSGRRGFHHLAVILVLIAYCFVGSFGGFGPAAGGHVPQEMVHLPGASRHVAITHDVQAALRSVGKEEQHAAVFQPGIDQMAGTAAPPAGKNPAVAAQQFAQFAQFIFSVFIDSSNAERPAETQTVAAVDPDWWLRTVVLHL